MASVLIVEDDRDLATITTRALEAEGFEVVAAGSAEAAYDLLTDHAFSCLVVDVNLPGDDGYELCTNLRKRSGSPVVFASARVEPDARVKALEVGGDVYLAKPFSLRELTAQVKALIRRESGTMAGGGDHQAKGAPLSLGPFEIDERAGTLKKEGAPITLSPKELALAAFLMRHPDETFSREALVSEIWGPFACVEPQTVAVHLSWIRSKLEDDPAHPRFFQTVRGRGYRFSAPSENSPRDTGTNA